MYLIWIMYFSDHYLIRNISLNLSFQLFSKVQRTDRRKEKKFQDRDFQIVDMYISWLNENIYIGSMDLGSHFFRKQEKLNFTLSPLTNFSAFRIILCNVNTIIGGSPVTYDSGKVYNWIIIFDLCCFHSGKSTKMKWKNLPKFLHIVEFRRYIDYAEEEKIKFGQVIYVNNSIQNITDI